MRPIVRNFSGIFASLAVLAGPGGVSLSAQPSGGRVAAGIASIAGGANAVTVIQISNRAIIDWQNFSTLAGDTVRFIQPDATSAILNRVISGATSSLAGTLEANGRVFLINPNGILVGAGARIDTGGFLASTLDVANTDFLAGGDLHFSGGSDAAITNLGAINALGGDVFLIARRVENTGTITAANGTAGLAGGAEVLLTTGGDERLFVQAASSPGTAINAGTITAATAELKAAGGNAYALAINNTGLVRATGSAVRNGQIWLVASSSGTVENSGTLDASGTAGGGKILVLGGMQDGGRVTVGGTLDASSTGGDGGFIETSAARVQVTDGARVTTTAPHGRSGTWLIDPVDFIIAASGGDMTGAAVGTALAGGNFTIQSTTGGTGTAGDVNVNDTVSWSANKLTLNAQNNINVNAAMNASGTASIALEYGQGAVAAGNTSNYVVKAAINLPAGNNFSTKLGSDGAVKSFTVITSLGVAGDASSTTLQGMKNSLSGNFALGADIDALATNDWTAGAGFMPVGTNGFAFAGSFAGLGHTICDLTINRTSTDYVGLFGYINSYASVRDVGLVGEGSVKGHFYVGGLVGYISGGTVSNSYATAVTVAAAEAAGGLVGRNYDSGTISNSYATGRVSTTSGYAGGLVADNNGTVIDSFATGNVSGNNNVGGLAGGGGGAFTNSYATGDVTGTSNSVGGLVGGYGFGTITNSYATGKVNGGAAAEHVGGLVGYNVQGDIVNSYATGAVTGNGNNVGGLLGNNNNGTITTSYSTGLVTSTGSSVGGLVGDNQGTVTSAFWNSQVNGATPGIGSGTTSGATGLTSGQMRTAASFTGFTFTTTAGAAGNNWVLIDEDGTLNNAGAATGATYPMLASEYATTIRGGHQLQLVQMAASASYTLDTHLLLSATGDGTDVWSSAGFVPIVNFTGTLDGLGRTISDLTINRPTATNVGLVGTGQGATIRNLGLRNPAITGQQQVGALVGFSTGMTVGTSYVIGGTVTGTTDVGGMIGKGGAEGFHPPHPTSVTDSYTSNVNVTGTTNVGGLIGFNSAGSVTNGYGASTVTGTSNVGGLLGSNLGNPGTLTNSFWDKTINATGIGSDALPGDTLGATGMTTAQLQQQANFTSATAANGTADPAWNFTDTWVMYDGHTAPLLRVFMKPLRVQAGDAVKTYDGLAYSGGTSVTYFDCPDMSLLFGTIGYSGSSQGAINVGSYAITPTGLYSNQQGYIITFSPGTLTVNKADLTLSGTRAYDGTTTFAGSFLTATGVHGETFTLNGAGASGNLTLKDVQTNQALVSVTGLTIGTGNSGAALASNYKALSEDNSTVSVTPADLTLSGTRVYNSTTNFAGSNLTATGVNGETFTVTGAGALGNLSTKNVQTDQLLASVAGLALGTGNSGAAIASNYNALSTVNSSVSVTPAPLTIYGFAAEDKVYDGNTTAVITTPGVLSGIVGEGGDDVGFTYTGATFDTKDVGTAKTVTLNGVTLNGADKINYTYTAVTTELSDITPADLILSGTRVYDGTPTFAAADLGSIATGVNGETFALTGSGVLSTKDVQTDQPLADVSGLTLGASGNGGLASNYKALSEDNSTVSVTPADLTLSGTRVYNGATNFAGSNLTATGVNGETFTVTGAGALGNLSTKNVQTDQLLASVAGLALGAGNSGAAIASNYNALSTVNSSVSVTPAPLTIYGFAAEDKVYDGNTTAVITTPGVLSGIVGEGGDDVGFTYTGATFDTKDVGTAKTVTLNGVTLNGADKINYTYTAVTTELSEITPATLTYTADLVSRTYGSANPALTGTVTGFAPGETVTNATTGTAAFTTTATIGSNVGTYAIYGSGLTANNDNYDFEQADGNETALTINRANLILSGTRVYDGTTIFGGSLLTATGVLGETFTVTGAGAAGNLTTKNVQTNQALASVGGLTLGTSGNGGLAGNYNALAVAGSQVSVTPAALTVTANNASKTYGQTVTFGGTEFIQSGLITGETIGSVSLASSGAVPTASVAGGPYAITASAATGGTFTPSNYTIAYVDGSLDVAALLITVTADNASKTYGQTTSFAGTEFTVSSSLPNGEAIESVTLTSAGAAAAAGVSGSPYNIFASAASGTNYVPSNYRVIYVPGSLTVNPANLTLSGTRVYDGTTAFAGSNLTATGVNGESFTVTGAGAAGNLSTKNVQTNQALASVGGLTLGTGNTGTTLASNYNGLTVAGSTVSVTKAPLTVSAADVVKTYDGGTTASSTAVVTAGTLFSGDVLAYGPFGPSFAFVGKDVGVGNKTVTVSGVGVNDGNGGNNYTLTLVNNTTSTINPFAVNLTGTRAYNGTVNVAANIFTFGTLVGSETLTLGGTGTVGDKNVSANQTVSVTGLTLGDGTGLASNYTFTGGTQVARITAADLRLTGTRVYDGTTVFGGSLLTATGVNGETFTVTGAGVAGNLASKHVQTNQALASVGGLVLGTSGNGGLAGNYNALSVAGSQVSVTPAALTVTANNASKTYGQTITFAGTEFASTGLVTGDTIGSVSLSSAGAAATAGVAGSPYAITASAATGGSFAATDYTISYVNGALTVNPAALAITANNANKVYGQTTTFGGTEFTPAGLQNGETIGSVTLASPGAAAAATVAGSPYAITPSAATGGTFSASNYTLSYVNGVLTVTDVVIPPPVSNVPLTISADNKAMTYGGVLPVFTASFNGFINGDTPASVTGLQFNTTATIGSNTGTYTITPFGATAPAYYLIGYVPGVLTINPAQLTITANNVTRPFGATTPGFTASYTGLVNGDTSSVVSGLAFSTTATGSPGDFTIIPGGATAQNYTLIYVNGLLHVIMPVVPVGGSDVPVLVVDDEPLLTPDFAVIEQAGHPVLVSLGAANALPPGDQLAITLGEATNPPPVAESTGPGLTGFGSIGGPNFGNYEPVSPSGNSGAGAAQPADPGLFRETSLNQGGFNIVYHEPADEVQQQDGENASAGSSYREFSDTDNPQTSLVRSKVERKSGESAAGGSGGGAL